MAAEACLKPWQDGTKPARWPTKPGPYKIAISNSYIGNTWRTEMVQVAKSYVSRPEVAKDVASLRVASAGNDVAAQIAQLNEMTLAGVDAIILNAASPTGLNSAINQAAAAGILVVSFDNVVTTPKAIKLNQDQYQMGKAWAQFVLDQTGGKGSVLMVRGVAGTFVDQERTRAAMELFKPYPDLKLTEVYGEWDDGTGQKVTANALAAGGKFDAVWSQGGTTGVCRAIQQAGQKIPPTAGEAENGFRKLAYELKFPMLSIGQSPTLSALSIMAAVNILKGEPTPSEISIPLPVVTNETLEPGKNFFPDLPDSLFTAINIGACGLEFDVNEVLAQKV
ncbi:monosaccharide ABC transporter substrate-binding protein, CUT2 family [Arboricoccus pini]|uniref:Monosaccharide ABC transporter substrate-binding protein, CUT2 family n=2 Tax=Arboricoccus pini TaxID=1963835 RepID=A0A212S0L7_9PROT|nr:monosaccharide ABC transporter substrate-binding protein, CUT2 family [Arboricoccus pini]